MLFVLKAHVHRCRDCHRRFWVGVEWGRVILASLTAVVAMSLIVVMVVVRLNQSKPKPVPPPARARRLRRFQPLPPGLPPLSKVPAPIAKKDGAAKTDQNDSVKSVKSDSDTTTK